MEALRRRDRGQLLIITAISLAILLVLMALALNTAVYGVIHAGGADDDLREERSAVRYEDDVRRGIAGLIPAVDETTDGDYDTHRMNLSRAVANWSHVAGRQEVTDGVATNASLAEARFETDVVHDNESRAFTNRSDAANWAVADNLSAVDRYEMGIARERLVNTSDCSAEGTCFELTVDGGAWVLTAYRTNQKVVIRIDAGDTTKCETTNPPVAVNLTNGSFDHADCSGETFTPVDGESGAPYAIRYANADNVTGTYELRGEGRVDESDYHAAGSGASPRVVPRLVGANVTVTYRSPELHYRTTIRVDPGETDG
ncbi:hypothetical protein HWV23_15630 [Natronomonas halophila]|uniref:hypothetical protein n=1 Tax=Natronomonas halophila TaxID=2747817 RepID=UPI0015B5E288|nr:hypothetical protein [Natronomonas halophila]QLD87092.1 hypothetical protein HWV23_15630 [Natronomonas halophila]